MSPIQGNDREVTPLPKFRQLINYEQDRLFPNEENAQTSASPKDISVIKLVDKILFDAISANVSDIHFETYEHKYRIRYRQDGLLREVASPALHLSSQITSRVKVMANLDITERRLPQDGRFTLLANNQKIDFRISTCPTLTGEKIVIRLLNPHQRPLTIGALGLNKQQRRCLMEAIRKPQGMILVTGPTGSGKTVSLYAILNRLNTQEKNISTIEDPVEINLENINQVNVNPPIGLTFSKTLRALLRQDPDIIMVGEIRDFETAEIAIKAAQTGHLMLSTLHTNSAVAALTRLNNLGISAFNIGSSLNLIIAQRLVRRLCRHCKIPRDDLSSRNLQKLNLSSDYPLFKPVGCPQCNQGYRGRIALFEVLPLTSSLNELILSGSHSLPILKQAQAAGMQTLYQSGLEKIKQGITSLEEVKRVVMTL